MDSLTNTEKELDEALSAFRMNFLLKLGSADEIDPELSAKADLALERAEAALKGRADVPRTLVGKLVLIPLTLWAQADRASDPVAVRAAARHYQERICTIFPEATDETGT